MPVHVAPNQLRAAFRAHAEQSVSCCDESAALLLFYSVECGLKYLLLTQRPPGNTTADLTVGHDLAKCIRQLKWPATIVPDLTDFTTRGGRSVHVKALHEVFRYGAKLQEAEMKRALRALNALNELISKRI